MENVFKNARIVTPQGCVTGSICLRDGKISSVANGSGRTGEDMGGDYLIPGLIEMHTDNLEGKFQPRPGVLWPSSLSALMTHDMQIIGAGITTVLDSVCCGQLNEGKMRNTLLAMSVDAIKDGRKQDLLRADHLLHLRCEICDPHAIDMFEPYVDEDILKLVSLMDHTPGQRQYCSIEKYREYYQNEDMPEEVFQALMTRLKGEQNENASRFRAMIVAMCRHRGIPLASHDDTTLEHVQEAVSEGLSISEFPTTLEAARAAKAHGLGTVMGAPNVVRGGSHSGNVAAKSLAAEGLLDILSSDYVPVSLLHGAFMLHTELSLPLEKAIATVTENPAHFLRLHDRGQLTEGRRGDMVRVSYFNNTPVVRAVWRAGKRII